MDRQALDNIALRPFEAVYEIEDVSATYIGSKLPLCGTVSISVSLTQIMARLRNADDWLHRSLRAVAKGSASDVASLFRMPAPGFLVRKDGYGNIRPSTGGWIAKRSVYGGMSSDGDDTYRFDVGELVIDGQSAGAVASAFRQIYSRTSISADVKIQGRTITFRSLTRNPLDIDSELVAATSDSSLEPDILEAVRLALSFITGNTVRHVAEEVFDDAGVLIQTRHQNVSLPDDKRRPPFHRYYGPLASGGPSSIVDGMYKLRRADFPIGVVLQHAHEAAHRAHDIEAQHLVLAIHTAIEAWNRMLGLEVWIDDRIWDKYQRNLRKASIPAEVYDDIGDEMRENIRSALAHANRTTTAWRESSFFGALKIDVSDEGNTRALKLRDELLHSGFFVKRWSDLTELDQQQRLDDIRRLNRLVILIVLRLTSYNGAFMNPLTLQHESVTEIQLPAVLCDA